MMTVKIVIYIIENIKGTTMKDVIIRSIKNISNPNEFIFSITCTACHKEWKSTPIPFSKANQLQVSDSKKIVLQALYQQEMQVAANKAVQEAQKHLNYCPVCKTMVCNSCFMICDDIDLCVDCGSALQEHGEIVEPRK